MSKRLALTVAAAIAMASLPAAGTAQQPGTVAISNATGECFIVTAQYHRYDQSGHFALIGTDRLGAHASRVFTYPYQGAHKSALSVHAQFCTPRQGDIQQVYVNDAYPKEVFRIVQVGSHFEIEMTLGKH